MDDLTERVIMPEELDQPHRSYDRTWAEIEAMLECAEVGLVQWKNWYEQCRKK